MKPSMPRVGALRAILGAAVLASAVATILAAGVDALPSDVKAMVIRRVATFSDFNADNDPHAEHDFGSFELSGRKFFFKLDYYDSAMEFGSEDPTDPAKTTRVLTISKRQLKHVLSLSR